MNISNLKHIFLALVFIRYFTEQLDKVLGLPLSPLITSIYIVLASLLAIGKSTSKVERNGFYLQFFLIALVIQGAFSMYANSFELLGVNIKQLLKYFSYFSVFVISRSLIRTTSDLLRLAKYIAIVTGIVCTIAICQFFLGIGHADIGVPRPFGMSSHPALFALLVVVSMVTVGIIGFEVGRVKLSKKALFLIFSLSLLALLLTQARTTWAVVMLTLLGYLLARRKIKEISIVFLIGLLAAPFVLNRLDDVGGVMDFITEEKYTAKNHYEVIESSLHWRIIHWYVLIKKANEKPLMGWSPGATIHLGDYEKEAHSSIVEIFVEQGYVGIFLYFALVISIGAYLAKTTKRLMSITRFIIIGQFLGIFAASAFGQGVFNETQIMQTIMLQLGIVNILSSMKKDEQKKLGKFSKCKDYKGNYFAS